MIDKKARDAIEALTAMCLKEKSITEQDAKFVFNKLK